MTTERPLLERTYHLLDATELTYREIAAGAGVDINWLAKFKQRAIGEPGISKVQGLHDFLSGLKARRAAKTGRTSFHAPTRNE